MRKQPEPILFCDSASGQYIPQRFANEVNRAYVYDIRDEDFMILEEGPDNELYWEAWETVLNTGKLKDSQGVTWFLHQDGDLWLLPENYEGPLLEDC